MRYNQVIVTFGPHGGKELAESLADELRERGFLWVAVKEIDS